MYVNAGRITEPFEVIKEVKVLKKCSGVIEGKRVERLLKEAWTIMLCPRLIPISKRNRSKSKSENYFNVNFISAVNFGVDEV